MAHSDWDNDKQNNQKQEPDKKRKKKGEGGRSSARTTYLRGKPRSIVNRRLTRAEMAAGKELLPYMDYKRPKTRGECRDGPRPCPFVSCRYHLYLDVNPKRGTIKLNFPGMEVWEMPFTCALDIAERGGITLEETGKIMNLARERVRQLEAEALKKLRKLLLQEGKTLESFLGKTDDDLPLDDE